MKVLVPAVSTARIHALAPSPSHATPAAPIRRSRPRGFNDCPRGLASPESVICFRLSGCLSFLLQSGFPPAAGKKPDCNRTDRQPERRKQLLDSVDASPRGQSLNHLWLDRRIGAAGVAWEGEGANAWI